MRVYTKAEEDRQEAVAAGHRAPNLLQQIYQDADRFVVEKQQAVDEQATKPNTWNR